VKIAAVRDDGAGNADADGGAGALAEVRLQVAGDEAGEHEVAADERCRNGSDFLGDQKGVGHGAPFWVGGPRRCAAERVGVSRGR
jgi:hypothetical protein